MASSQPLPQQPNQASTSAVQGLKPSSRSAPRSLKSSSNPLKAKKKPQPSKPYVRPNWNNLNHTNGAGTGNLSAAPFSLPVEPQEDFEDFPLVTTKGALMDGLRHHAMRFVPNRSSEIQNVDPLDNNQFEKPIRLYRRDPRADPTNLVGPGTPMSEGSGAGGNPEEDKEKARIEAIKAEKKAEREASLAQIAPGKATQKKKPQKFRKQIEQVFQFNDTEHHKKDMSIRYEEKLPWHVEDFENKNVWRGTYETALSESHVALVKMNDQRGQHFRMVPVEKWYKFTPKNKFKALTLEEAEANMKKKVRDPAFLARAREKTVREKHKEREREAGRGLFTRRGERGEQPTAGPIKNEDDVEKPDIPDDTNDIDFNYNEDFADDEEDLFNNDDRDELKEIEEKIKKEQQEANVFDIKEEKDYDEEEAEQKRKEAEQRKQYRKTQRALLNHEKKDQYKEDSESNPYGSSSESEDSEKERLEEEERRKKEQEQEQQAPDQSGKGGKPSPGLASGASTKGTTTPTGRPAKAAADPLRKGILKRPGSPVLSEASGSESARKRPKMKHNAGGHTPTISRPGSPPNASSPTGSQPQRLGSNLKNKLDPTRLGGDAGQTRKRKSASGATSGSEGETSDRAKRVKRDPRAMSPGAASSRPGSPPSSRPGSPPLPKPKPQQPKTPKPGKLTLFMNPNFR